MNVMTISSRLGPMIRMISLMAKDVAIFLVMLFIYVVGFAGTFHVWFKDAVDDAAADMEDLRESIITTVNAGLPTSTAFEATAPADLEKAGFDSMFHSMLTLFSASMGDFSFDAIRKSETAPNWLGPTLMTLYLFIGAVMLLNLLIAILSDVYTRVNDSSKKEVSFTKAKTVSEFRIFWNGNKTAIMLPPPLNLLTMPTTSVSWLFDGAAYCLGRSEGSSVGQQLRRGTSLLNAIVLIAICSAAMAPLLWAGTVVLYLALIPAITVYGASAVLSDMGSRYWLFCDFRYMQAKKWLGGKAYTHAVNGPSHDDPDIEQHLKLNTCQVIFDCPPLKVLRALLAWAFFIVFMVLVFVGFAAAVAICTVGVMFAFSFVMPLKIVQAGIGSLAEVCDGVHLDFPAWNHTLKKFAPKTDDADAGEAEDDSTAGTKQLWRKAAGIGASSEEKQLLTQRLRSLAKTRHRSAAAQGWFEQLISWKALKMRQLAVDTSEAERDRSHCTDARGAQALKIERETSAKGGSDDALDMHALHEVMNRIENPDEVSAKALGTDLTFYFLDFFVVDLPCVRVSTAEVALTPHFLFSDFVMYMAFRYPHPPAVAVDEVCALALKEVHYQPKRTGTTTNEARKKHEAKQHCDDIAQRVFSTLDAKPLASNDAMKKQNERLLAENARMMALLEDIPKKSEGEEDEGGLGLGILGH